jgi:hypothetical protein
MPSERGREQSTASEVTCHSHRPGDIRAESGQTLDLESMVDIVDETSERSFPASDSPAWSPMTGVDPPCPASMLKQTVRSRG